MVINFATPEVSMEDAIVSDGGKLALREKGIIDVQAKGDKVEFTRVSDLTPAMMRAHEVRTNSDNGWNKFGMRQIGCIDQSIFTKYPHFKKDGNALKKWLMSDEGGPFRTVPAIDSVRNGRIRVR